LWEKYVIIFSKPGGKVYSKSSASTHLTYQDAAPAMAVTPSARGHRKRMTSYASTFERDL
jgi:hypothetical protein